MDKRSTATVPDTAVSYRIIRSDRKTLSIQITKEAEVIARAPRRMAVADIEAFIKRKQGWIDTKRQQIMARREAVPDGLPETFDEAFIAALTAEARKVIPPLVAEWAGRMGVTYKRVTIRHQKSLWGSCSSKENLNFNCLLMLCPADVRTYVVIHELCHRRHMDHSAAFWAEVGRYCPQYKALRAWLKTNGGEWMRRLQSHESSR